MRELFNICQLLSAIHLSSSSDIGFSHSVISRELKSLRIEGHHAGAFVLMKVFQESLVMTILTVVLYNIVSFAFL